MMTVECAVSLAMKCCHRLSTIIEQNESRWKSMDGKRRSEMGAWRCLLHHVGVPKDQLPDMPFLDPEHLEAFLKRQEAYKESRQEAIV